MLNDQTSVFNSALLGSGGDLKFVRMSSSVTGSAVTTHAVLTVGAPRFILRGEARATSQTKLYKARALKGEVQLLSSSNTTLSYRYRVKLASHAQGEASFAGTLRIRHPLRITHSAFASASGAVVFGSKGALKGSFYAQSSGSLVFRPRRYRRVAGDGMCFTSKVARIVNLKLMGASLPCYATGSCRFANNSMDLVPERTMYVSFDDRLMAVAGGR